MFLIFSLNRNDIFSPEDLGLIKAIGKNYYNGKIPEKKLAEELALKWSLGEQRRAGFYGEVLIQML